MTTRKIYTTLLLLASLIFFGCASAFKAAENKMKQGNYEGALVQYKKLLAETKDDVMKAKANYMIGECYRLSNRMTESEPYYRKAFVSKKLDDENLLYHYAFALKNVGNYESAKKGFTKYAQEGTDYKQTRRARDELAALKEVEKIAEPNKYVTIENCDALNTEGAEYSPIIFNDKLVFTSNRNSQLVYEATGKGFHDLFYYDLKQDDNCSGVATPFNEIINLDGFHEASPTFTRNGRVMIFARSNSGKKRDMVQDVKLYYSTFDGEQWSEAKILYPVSSENSKSWDACPALTADGKRLYFASNRAGGYGGIDIFRSDLQANGQWTRPRNMGKVINSRGNDMFPFVTKAGELHFASDGHPGLGGLDLFRATRRDGEIKVMNMGAPINSNADDFALTLTTPKTGYFSSNRSTDGAKGDDDIFYFEDKSPETKTVNYYLAGTSFVEQDINRTLLPNVAMKLYDDRGRLLSSTQSDSTGRFKFDLKLDIGFDYTVVADKETYIAENKLFTTIGKGVPEEELVDSITNITFETDVILYQNIFADLEIEDGGGEDGNGRPTIVLEGILYDLDESEIRPDAARELDKLVAYLKSRDKIRVELGSHTDSRGRDGYNMKLSRRRAEAAVAYLVAQGIDPTRIEAKGYGETQFLIPNAVSEEEHQQNRRTTVTIIGTIDDNDEGNGEE
ncbi:MAG: OmpA family protein [Bacteroidota bacterium]